LIIDNNNNIEGEQTMNDQVKQESVENTASQDNAGVNEVSNNQDVANKVFSADQLEQIVQRRLERYKKTVSNKLDGIDIEEAKKLLQEKKEKELEIAKQRGEFDKVLKETVSKKDSKIQSLESELKRIRIDETLVNVASGLKAVKPAEVKQLLRNNVRLNDQGSVEVINEDGTPRYSEKGEPMSVNDLVNEYLKNNPHHVMATQSGSGSQSKIGGASPKQLKIGDLDLSNPNDRKVYAEMRKQRDQGLLKMKITTNNN
jgi:hypothetical protein